jgi:hypothetical protein
MGVEDLFRIAGQVAGIGGLSICLFLLIARHILKAVPQPGSTPAKGYLKLIDKMLLYAFVLSMAGLMIYAVTRYIELSNILSENHRLHEMIKNINDPTLKANSLAFEVLSCEVVFDLTDWRKVPKEKLATSKEYQEITTNTRSIWRASLEATKFFGGTYSTDSTFEPDIISLSPRYPVTKIKNSDPIQPGNKSSEPRWDLMYDVQEAPLFKSFDIVTRSTVWNARPDPNVESEGTLIRFPTRNLTLIVKFPKHKLPRKNGFELDTMPLSDPISRKQTKTKEGKLTVAPDLTWVKWEISQPKLLYHYLIYWHW